MQRAHPPATLTGWMVRVIATRLPSARFARLVAVMVVMVVCVCGRATPCGSCLVHKSHGSSSKDTYLSPHFVLQGFVVVLSSHYRRHLVGCRFHSQRQVTPRAQVNGWMGGETRPRAQSYTRQAAGRVGGGAGSGGGQQVAGQEVYGARQVGDRVDQVRVSPHSLYYHNAIVERVPCFSQGQHARTRSGYQRNVICLYPPVAVHPPYSCLHTAICFAPSCSTADFRRLSAHE